MRRALILLPVLLLAATQAPAGEVDPAAFLAAAREKHADLTARGLASFSARVSLRRADDENVARIRDSIRFTYSFTGPEQEDFDMKDTVEAARKPVRDALTGMWREVTGALWFAEFAAAPDLRADAGERSTMLTGTGAKTALFQATFDKAALRLDEAVFGADTATRAWTFEETPGGLRVRRRDVSLKGAFVFLTTYEVVREVAGFALPTVVRIKADGKWTEFGLEYTRINGKAAAAAPVDPAFVKAKVEEFEKAWKAFPADEKGEKVRGLADLDHDLASAAIAKLALKDASADVRREAAGALGLMKRHNVVPALLAALPANEDEIRVYLALVEALGEIGDPRAVDALSKDWWNQRVPEYGVIAAKTKVQALGRIRHATSVDALLDTFTVAAEDRIGQLRGDIVESLKKLTGQDFAYDRKAWGDWWKKNRSGFRF